MWRRQEEHARQVRRDLDEKVQRMADERFLTQGTNYGLLAILNGEKSSMEEAEEEDEFLPPLGGDIDLTAW